VGTLDATFISTLAPSDNSSIQLGERLFGTALIRAIIDAHAGARLRFSEICLALCLLLFGLAGRLDIFHQLLKVRA